MKKCAEIKCDRLEDVMNKDDVVFYIRDGKTQGEQADILSKSEACLFEDAIKFTYNSFNGSCQTFCSKILGSNLLSELNFEVTHDEANTMKALAGWFLSDEDDSDDLIKKMTERMESRTPFDLPPGNEELLKTCPERLGLRLEERMRST